MPSHLSYLTAHEAIENLPPFYKDVLLNGNRSRNSDSRSEAAWGLLWHMLQNRDWDEHLIKEVLLNRSYAVSEYYHSKSGGKNRNISEPKRRLQREIIKAKKLIAENPAAGNRMRISQVIGTWKTASIQTIMSGTRRSKSNDLAVLEVLHDIAQSIKDTRVSIAFRTLGERVCAGKSTAEHAINRLVEDGMIRHYGGPKRGRAETNVYVMVNPSSGADFVNDMDPDFDDIFDQISLPKTWKWASHDVFAHCNQQKRSGVIWALLHANHRGLTVDQISRAFRFSAPTVEKRLIKLEELGLVSRKDDVWESDICLGTESGSLDDIVREHGLSRFSISLAARHAAERESFAIKKLEMKRVSRYRWLMFLRRHAASLGKKILVMNDPDSFSIAVMETGEVLSDYEVSQLAGFWSDMDARKQYRQGFLHPELIAA